MPIVDQYTEDLTIKLSSGKTLKLDASNITITGTVASLTVSGAITANGGITTTQSFNIESTLNYLKLIGSSYVSMLTDASSNFITILSGQGISSTVSDDKMFTIKGNSNVGAGSTPSPILKVRNQDGTANSDGVQVQLDVATPLRTSYWMRFTFGGSETLGGGVRGARTTSSVAFVADGSDGGGAVDSPGDCVYASGASDFGEWVIAGDEYENGDSKYIGLPEGYVVYVNDGKFHSSSPGTPMVVTHRAIVVGNEKERSESGEILSFIGQVPVYVKGKVFSGDFLIPTGDFYCEAVSSDKITFEQYKKSIGVAWESSDDENLKKVLAAIGIKAVM